MVLHRQGSRRGTRATPGNAKSAVGAASKTGAEIALVNITTASKAPSAYAQFYNGPKGRIQWGGSIYRQYAGPATANSSAVTAYSGTTSSARTPSTTWLWTYFAIPTINPGQAMCGPSLPRTEGQLLPEVPFLFQKPVDPRNVNPSSRGPYAGGSDRSGCRFSTQ